MNNPLDISENHQSAFFSSKTTQIQTPRSFGTDITNAAPNFLNSKTDPQVADYVPDIFSHLHSTEELFMAKAGYMLLQEKISEKMRSILMNWLVEVHFKFKLTDETLFLTVNIIDRYLQSSQCNKEHLQLVGVTSMLIASKYEEIYPPEVKDFVYITDNAYVAQEVLQMENRILKSLNFNLTVPSSFRFLQRYSKVCELDELSFNFARYVLELSLVDYKFLRYKPSTLAIAAIFVAQRVTKCCCRDLSCVFGYCETEVRGCAKELICLVARAEGSSLQGVRKKFLTENFLCVAKIVVRY